MKIALLGASGRIGQRITQEALARGHEIEALVRDPATLPIERQHLSVARVDLFDSQSIAQAITGADVVVNATGAHGINPHVFYVTSTQAVIEGVRCAGGDKRLIVVGGAGSLEVAPGVHYVDTPEFSAAARPTSSAQLETLELLRASDIAWTFFSPSATIAPGRRTGAYRLGTTQLLRDDSGKSYISMEDYAVALLDEIERPRFIRQQFTAASLEA